MARIEDYIKGLKPGSGEVRIPKSLITEWSAGWYRSVFNLPKDGSIASYRNKALHIHEMENCYIVHIDKVDPQVDPMGHLIEDAPQVIAAAVTIAVSAILIYALTRKGKGEDKQ